MRILIVIILMLLTALAHGQTHTMPGSNVVPSGASLTINSGGSITAAAGSTVTGFMAIRVASQASNATWAPNADTTDIFVLTLQAAAATTISNPSGTPVAGQKLIIRAKCDGTARALTWSGSQWRASSDLALPTTLTASKTMYLGFIYNATDTKWDLLAKLDNF